MIMKKSRFKAAWSEFSNLWTIDGWEFSRYEVDFLDVSIFRPEGCGRLHYYTHWKPTSLGVCLSPSSVHNTSIHVSWVFSELGRIARTSSSRERFNIGKAAFVNKLQANHFPEIVIDQLCRYDPHSNSTRSRNRGRSNRLLMVVPFHPAILSLARNVLNYGLCHSGCRHQRLQSAGSLREFILYRDSNSILRFQTEGWMGPEADTSFF